MIIVDTFSRNRTATQQQNNQSRCCEANPVRVIQNSQYNPEFVCFTYQQSHLPAKFVNKASPPQGSKLLFSISPPPHPFLPPGPGCAETSPHLHLPYPPSQPPILPLSSLPALISLLVRQSDIQTIKRRWRITTPIRLHQHDIGGREEKLFKRVVECGWCPPPGCNLRVYMFIVTYKCIYIARNYICIYIYIIYIHIIIYIYISMYNVVNDHYDEVN